MSQKDWIDVQNIIEEKLSGFLEKFLTSDDIFLPNNTLANPFNENHSNFSASDLGKSKLG